jgi:hypothetical protein
METGKHPPFRNSSLPLGNGFTYRVLHSVLRRK